MHYCARRVLQASRLQVARLGRFSSTLAQQPEASTISVEPHTYKGSDQTSLRTKQAPNRDETWAPSQRPRSEAMTGVLFDGKDLAAQPRPLAAIDLVDQSPVLYVSHMAACDGNTDGHRGGVQGHPKIYINVDKSGIHACQYCGTRYADKRFQADIESGKVGLVI